MSAEIDIVFRTVALAVSSHAVVMSLREFPAIKEVFQSPLLTKGPYLPQDTESQSAFGATRVRTDIEIVLIAGLVLIFVQWNN